MFAVVLLFGLAIRVMALRSSFAQQDSDRAVVYLMARHVARGDLRTFYWGQGYGGTMLQLTAGALFRLVGSSFVALQIVEIGFWLGACLLVRSIVVRACGVLVGDVAGCLFWLATPFVLALSFSDPGFYGSGLVVGLIGVRVAQSVGDRPEWQVAGAVGLCLGLALWTTPFALAFTVPAAIWVGARIRAWAPRLIGIGAAVLGAAPWLWANEHSGMASLQPQSAGRGSFASRYWHVFTQVVPAIAGYAPTSIRGWVVAGLFLFAPFVGVACALRRGNIAVGMLCLSAVLVPMLLAGSGAPIVAEAPRYATFMLPAVVGVLAWMLGRRPLIAMLMILFVASWTFASVWGTTNGLDRVAEPATGTPTAQLAAYLEHEGRTAVWADYWESYLLSAATQERVTAAAIGTRREPAYEAAAIRPAQTTVVLFAGDANDHVLGRRRDLPPYHRTRVGTFAVYVFAGRVDVPAHLH